MKKRTRLTTFPEYAEARSLARGITCSKEYAQKRVDLGLPSNPDKYYKGKGWTNWADFLDREPYPTKPDRFMPYDQAKKLMRKHGVRNSYHYAQVRKQCGSLPVNPARSYRKEWGGWKVFLGIGAKTMSRVFVSYDKAKTIVIAHRVRSRRQFYTIAHLMRRMRIPTHPDLHYKQWTGWSDFLRPTNNVAVRIRPVRSKRKGMRTILASMVAHDRP